MHRRIVTACAIALLFSPGPALARTSSAAADGGAQPVPAISRTRAALETAETLIRGLMRRSLAIAQRSPAALPVAAARPARIRVASRISGAASHRAAAPAPPAANLLEYLGILARVTPGGTVTGRFSDWRSASVYRAVSGRHNGYDVAHRAGAVIVAGWPGRVSAITPWYGAEYGITVISPDGFRTTYGHLAPGVRVGQWLEPGDAVGTIVRDHVDIKMKDAGGHPIDFAKGVPLSARPTEKAQPSALVIGATGSETSVFPPLSGPDWTLRQEAVRAALEYLRLRCQEMTLLGSGTAAPVALLSQVRHQIGQARERLAVEEVPEEVLLAAFLDVPAFDAGLMLGTDGGGGANALADWLRRRQVASDARRAAPQLQALLVDLGR